MIKVEIGQLLQEGKTRYQEGAKFDATQAGTNLYLFFNSPSLEEINSVKRGKFEIAFCEIKDILFFLAKFEGMQWMDAPYNVHLSKPFEFMEIENDKGFSLTVHLIDALTGILKAIRYIGLGNKFSKELKNAIHKQKDLLFDKKLYFQSIQRAYVAYSSKDLAKRAIHSYKVKR